jgi:hypothetical protein
MAREARVSEKPARRLRAALIGPDQRMKINPAGHGPPGFFFAKGLVPSRIPYHG